MLLNHNLPSIKNQNIQLPLETIQAFKTPPLSFLWIYNDIIIQQINDKYDVYDSKSFQKSWGWIFGIEPTRIFFYTDYIIAYEKQGIIIYEKTTGKKSQEVRLNLRLICQNFGLITYKKDGTKFLAKIRLDNLVQKGEIIKLWKTPVSNTVFWHNLFQQDKLILNLKKEKLVCIDWQTGDRLWEINGDNHYKHLGHNIFNTRQVIWKDSIISAYGDIISLDINTGEKKWQKPFKIGINGLSVDSLGRLYALTYSKYLVLDADSGDVILEKPTQEVLSNFDYSEIGFQCPFPTVTDQHIIFANGTSHLLFANKFTGGVEWSYHFEDAKQVGHPLKLENGRLFLVVDYNLVVMEQGNPPQG